MNKPTIGIEIELPWRYMLERVDPEAGEIMAGGNGFYTLSAEEQARVQQGFEAVDAEYKERINDVFGEDIANGNDGFAEFALRPKAESEELVQVTAGLFEEGILRDDELYSLHITLGNVACNRSAWLAIMATELSGGTTPDRIKQCGTWERKGHAGIMRRFPHEMALGARQGFEMRTLALHGLHGLEQTLRVAQDTGHLLAKRDGNNKEARDSLRDLYRHLIAGTQEKDVDATIRWANPSKDITPWSQISAALEDPAWQARMQAGVLGILSDVT